MSPRSGSEGSPGAPMPISGQGLGLRWQKAANSSAMSLRQDAQVALHEVGRDAGGVPRIFARADDAPCLPRVVDSHHAIGGRAVDDLLHGNPR